MALQKLKQVCQQPLPLKIPGTGHRILRPIARNEFGGAVLIEEENERKHFCGHASGQFKDSEKHYHAVYKEILAIKYGIKKFEFHLIGHHFTIMMDNTLPEDNGFEKQRSSRATTTATERLVFPNTSSQ
ncbi:UNVERIFIED_CONTAM: polyprotein [Sesamum radiatum]|uniref:Polyprotein n=1 Tax=Sesamum radiatum TaxID=300843 RepID=A0AAW2IPD3_SESRA